MCDGTAEGPVGREPEGEAPQPGCTHDWVYTHRRTGLILWYECSECGAEEERDVS